MLTLRIFQLRQWEPLHRFNVSAVVRNRQRVATRRSARAWPTRTTARNVLHCEPDFTELVDDRYESCMGIPLN